MSKIPKKICEVPVLKVSVITEKPRGYLKNFLSFLFPSFFLCKMAGNELPPCHLLCPCLLPGIRTPRRRLHLALFLLSSLILSSSLTRNPNPGSVRPPPAGSNHRHLRTPELELKLPRDPPQPHLPPRRRNRAATVQPRRIIAVSPSSDRRG